LSTFTVNYQTGEQVLPITAFTATASCGNAIWKYTAFDSNFRFPLVYATDMIEVNPLTGAIKVNTNKAPGTYDIGVIGKLPDLTMYGRTFTI